MEPFVFFASPQSSDGMEVLRVARVLRPQAVRRVVGAAFIGRAVLDVALLLTLVVVIERWWGYALAAAIVGVRFLPAARQRDAALGFQRALIGGELTVDASGIRRATPQTFYGWSAFSHAVETSKSFVLMLTPVGGVVLAKRDLGGGVNEDRIRTFIIDGCRNFRSMA